MWGLMSMPVRRMPRRSMCSTGELVRARFGPGVEEPVAWLAGFAGSGAGLL